MRRIHTGAVLTSLFVWSLAMTPAAQADVIVSPHHAEPGHPGSPTTHYFEETGDDHHYSWAGGLGLTPTPVTIKYDFRSQGGFPNLITPDEKDRALDALSGWAAAANFGITFVQDTTAPSSMIINIGRGDLAALGGISSPHGVLGLASGDFTHGAVNHTITFGVAWMDKDETWDTVIGNGDSGGTFDFFTVAAQEIGHAMGLNHTDDLVGADVMDGVYGGEITTFSAHDKAHIQTLHNIPEPGSLIVWSVLGVGFGWRRRKPSRN